MPRVKPKNYKATVAKATRRRYRPFLPKSLDLQAVPFRFQAAVSLNWSNGYTYSSLYMGSSRTFINTIPAIPLHLVFVYSPTYQSVHSQYDEMKIVRVGIDFWGCSTLGPYLTTSSTTIAAFCLHQTKTGENTGFDPYENDNNGYLNSLAAGPSSRLRKTWKLAKTGAQTTAYPHGEWGLCTGADFSTNMKGQISYSEGVSANQNKARNDEWMNGTIWIDAFLRRQHV